MVSFLLCSLFIFICTNSISSTNELSNSLKRVANEYKTIPCPDGNVCDDGQTCCELSSDRYACCPHPEAVCCSDHLHCCPKDHTCEPERGRCRRNVNSLKSIICPDGITDCPDDSTCCPLDGGGYGCCPLVDAVCCSDHLHCCPHGKICDVQAGRCVSQISIPWSNKIHSFPLRQKLTKLIHLNESLSQLKSSMICPDGLTICNSSSTCCSKDDGSYECCPGQSAVCCSDGNHCCPSSYKCDIDGMKCHRDGFQSIPLLKKVQSNEKISSKIVLSRSIESSLSTIICPDGNSCPDQTTCCSLKNGTYGCCPFEDGICCSDKEHCCGNGYVCDSSGNRCIRHLIGEKKKLNEDQLCPDGKSKCSSNSTCCPNKNGKNELSYSCCPYSKGVCCGLNGSVCCPNGYDCNEDQLSCELKDQIKLNRSKRDVNQCGDSDVYCSSSETCCQSDQSFGCCPHPDGECCSDGIHCCPSGNRCDDQYGCLAK